LVLAGGRLVWDSAGRCFDRQVSDAAVPVLTEPGVLPVEPFFIDVSADAPWDAHAAPLREKITALAAPIHGKPKDQLASDDLREQRRFRRLRAAAITALVMLTAVAVIAAVIAAGQRRHAIHERNGAIALRLNAEAQSMLASATSGGDIRTFDELLAARKLAGPDESALLHAIAQRSATVKIVETGSAVASVAVNPDGDRLATGSSDQAVRLGDAGTGQPVGNPLKGHTGRC
jgi:hypothetical protein